MRAATCLFAGAVLLLAFAPSTAIEKGSDRSSQASDRFSLDAAAIPFTRTRVHRVGKIRFGVTNWGFIGSQSASEYDRCLDQRASSFEYPKRSGINYLYQGALWIGAVKGSDTLVSVGADGWNSTHEMYPLPAPEGDFVERTTRPILRAEQNSTCPDIFFSHNAVSEQDLVAVYTDTLTDTRWVADDPWDGPYHPLQVKVTQESYAWSYDYADEFVIIDWKIENIGTDLLRNVRLGLLVDADVGHLQTGEAFNDDICGFVRTVPSIVGLPAGDSINLAWAADNDGDPQAGGIFDSHSPTAALGIRFLKTPTGEGPASFNWWTSSSSWLSDWGPRRRVVGGIIIPDLNLGTPVGDQRKYRMLGNGEFDYDQIEAALDHQIDGWLPPVSNPDLAADIADGRDIYMLLGTEQFDLAPGQSVPLTVALIAGPQFHNDPRNFVSYFNPLAPDQFMDRLDFHGLVRNARWAGWMFDNPGRDTDGNGTRGDYVIVDGDTLYYTGDGVPDFRGPQPLPFPIRFETSPGRIAVRWNGYEPERARDRFTHVRNFEGYRVYIGRSWVLNDFALAAQRDRIDFLRREYDPIGNRWVVHEPAFAFDTLKALYDSLVQATRGYPFDPDSFADTSLSQALMAVTVNTIDPGVLDTNYYAFTPFDLNYQVDDAAAYYADSAGMNVVRIIRKPYPFAVPLDTLYRDDGTPFLPYYEYEYVIDGLYIGDPLYMAVTAFDFGDPPSGVGSSEGEIYGNAQEVWPLASGAAADSTRPAPGVYPNPYRVVDDYVGRGWERLNPDLPNPEYARQMTFYNLPDTCTISIWTLDGDLVRELRHRAYPGSPQAGFAIWDLINRNNDVITYGLYIYSIESRFGTHVGKLAIVR